VGAALEQPRRRPLLSESDRVHERRAARNDRALRLDVGTGIEQRIEDLHSSLLAAQWSGVWAGHFLLGRLGLLGGRRNARFSRSSRRALERRLLRMASCTLPICPLAHRGGATSQTCGDVARRWDLLPRRGRVAMHRCTTI
jgi:hypothetical protein